eukprot:464836-Prymnesium_polylepis.1
MTPSAASPRARLQSVRRGCRPYTQPPPNHAAARTSVGVPDAAAPTSSCSSTSAGRNTTSISPRASMQTLPAQVSHAAACLCPHSERSMLATKRGANMRPCERDTENVTAAVATATTANVPFSQWRT